jgi:hypothetical protein
MAGHIYAPDLYEPKRIWRTKIRDDFLRKYTGIDPAILADELGLTERFVISYQRKIGVRPFSGHQTKKNAAP